MAAVRGGGAAEELEPLSVRLNLTALGSGGAAESCQLSIGAMIQGNAVDNRRRCA